MPELPEVEITCQGIRTATLSRRIEKITIRQPKLRWPIPSSLSQLKNVEIFSIDRRAKYILMRTSKGTIIIHLGMSGRLRVLNQSLPAKKHDHVDFILDNKAVLRYTDPRRFGAVLWTSEDPLLYPLLLNLGVEPLSELFTGDYLYKSKNKKITVKQFIMDQQVVVGVGNIYANEALFAAGISPSRIASSLTKSECNQLVEKIQIILEQAILQGGTTLKDFLSPSGSPGYFVQELFVYGREGKQCLRCQERLQSIRIAQRATVFCQCCQK